jgi:hypothetical protein
MLYAIPQAKLLNFIKTKSEKSIFSKKKNQTEQIISMSESCSSTQLLFNKKKNFMLKRRQRVKLQTCFICKSLLNRQIKKWKGDENLDLHRTYIKSISV